IRLGFVLILAIALLTTVAPYGVSQETSAGITGKVTDPSGASVTNASVTARDTDRGTVWSTKTNEEGLYNFSRLPIGHYEVKVEATGFQTAATKALDLQLNQTAKIDIALSLGPVA